jgi:hypothetical protein
MRPLLLPPPLPLHLPRLLASPLGWGHLLPLLQEARQRPRPPLHPPHLLASTLGSGRLLRVVPRLHRVSRP